MVETATIDVLGIARFRSLSRHAEGMEKEGVFVDASFERSMLAAALLIKGEKVEARKQFCLAGSDLVRACEVVRKAGLDPQNTLIPGYLQMANANFDIAHKISIRLLRQS